MCSTHLNLFMVLAIILGATATNGPQPSSSQAASSQEQVEPIHLRGDLVEVPVIVRDGNNRYVPDLKKEDFIVTQDGVEQQIALLAHAEEPFQVALLLDTSGSTEEELPRIEQAAITFIRELHPRDRVMLVSFDDAVRVENEFTSDRRVLSQAIGRLRAGKSTQLYDAVYAVVKQRMQSLKGRKAMILFSDGVDTASQRANAKETLRDLEESNVIVYSIRYDTREAVRRQLRKPKTVNIGNAPVPVPTPGPSSWPGDQTPPPNQRTQRWPSPYPDPNPWPSPNPYPSPTPYPTPYPRRSPFPTPQPMPTPEPPSGPTRLPRRQPAPDGRLDREYQLGEQYLWELSDRTGGVFYEANLLRDLPGAFEQISEELRQQYTLGYYRSDSGRDGHYYRIRVRVNRSGTSVRARPGYRAQ